MTYRKKVAFRVNNGKTFTLPACVSLIDYIRRKDRMPLYFDDDDASRFKLTFGI